MRYVQHNLGFSRDGATSFRRSGGFKMVSIVNRVILFGTLIFLLTFVSASVGYAQGDPYADSVDSFTLGTYLFGATPPAPGDELNTLGAPDGPGWGPGLGGEIILEFVDNLVVDGPGNDLQINAFPPGSGSQELDNKAQVLVSADGVSFTAFPGFMGPGGCCYARDLAAIGLSQASFVKIVDSGSCCLSGNPSGGGDGFNIESLEAIASSPVATRKLVYYSLGDSVASGHGLPGDPGTGCRRSPGSYPRLVESRISDLQQHYGAVDHVSLACSEAESPDITTQVAQAIDDLRDRRLVSPTDALVSLTIGANDLPWNDFGLLGQMLCGARLEFVASVLGIADTVKSNVEAAVAELLNEGDVYLVITDYHNPINRKSHLLRVFLHLPGCQSQELTVANLYARTEIAVHVLNLKLFHVQNSTGSQNVALASIHSDFHGREGAFGLCGLALPLPNGSWVQTRAEPDDTLDCFHPNDQGADAFADAVEVQARDLLPLHQ